METCERSILRAIFSLECSDKQTLSQEFYSLSVLKRKAKQTWGTSSVWRISLRVKASTTSSLLELWAHLSQSSSIPMCGKSCSVFCWAEVWNTIYVSFVLKHSSLFICFSVTLHLPHSLVLTLSTPLLFLSRAPLILLPAGHPLGRMSLRKLVLVWCIVWGGIHRYGFCVIKIEQVDVRPADLRWSEPKRTMCWTRIYKMEVQHPAWVMWKWFNSLFPLKRTENKVACYGM